MSSLLPQEKEINCMQGYDVLKSFYLNCENYDPWVRGSGLYVELIWPQSENV